MVQTTQYLYSSIQTTPRSTSRTHRWLLHLKSQYLAIIGKQVVRVKLIPPSWSSVDTTFTRYVRTSDRLLNPDFLFVAAASDRCCRDLTQPIRPPPPLPPPRFPNNAVWHRQPLNDDVCAPPAWSPMCTLGALVLTCNLLTHDDSVWWSRYCREYFNISVIEAQYGSIDCKYVIVIDGHCLVLASKGRGSVARGPAGGSLTSLRASPSPPRHRHRASPTDTSSHWHFNPLQL